jgi:hypothetical protein
MNRKMLKLALPSIFANITVPLVGIVDLAYAIHLIIRTILITAWAKREVLTKAG